MLRGLCALAFSIIRCIFQFSGRSAFGLVSVFSSLDSWKHINSQNARTTGTALLAETEMIVGFCVIVADVASGSKKGNTRSQTSCCVCCATLYSNPIDHMHPYLYTNRTASNSPRQNAHHTAHTAYFYGGCCRTSVELPPEDTSFQYTILSMKKCTNPIHSTERAQTDSINSFPPIHGAPELHNGLITRLFSGGGCGYSWTSVGASNDSSHLHCICHSTDHFFCCNSLVVTISRYRLTPHNPMIYTLRPELY